MGLYHGVEHYEKLKINESSDVELFKSSWSTLLTDNFETRYDWSYIVAWVSFFPHKVEKILKGSLDIITSPSPSVKIQIIVGKKL